MWGLFLTVLLTKDSGRWPIERWCMRDSGGLFRKSMGWALSVVCVHCVETKDLVIQVAVNFGQGVPARLHSYSEANAPTPCKEQCGELTTLLYDCQ